MQALVVVIPARDGVPRPRRSWRVRPCVDEDVLDLITGAIVPQQAGPSGFGLVERQRHLLKTLFRQLAVGWTKTILISTAVAARGGHSHVRGSERTRHTCFVRVAQFVRT